MAVTSNYGIPGTFGSRLPGPVWAAAIALLMCLLLPAAQAAILPEERSDIMYHRYDGGGMVIDGPSVLVRKNFADKVSVAANYYVDNVSSASIDVVTIGASKYSEKRTEYSAEVTYIEDDMVFSFGITDSSENDYEATSYRLDLSHSFFGDMTTVSAGFSLGDDDISSTEDATLDETLDRRQYRLGIGQVLSRNLVLNLNYESIVDEGYLQNPYRRILWVNFNKPPAGTTLPGVYQLDTEIYPATRNSDALSLKLAYHLPWQGAVKSSLGYYSDSWGIDGFSLALEYSHRLSQEWALDLRLRHYQQGDADFYANLFYDDTKDQNFRARDKELSEYKNLSAGIGARFERELPGFFTKYALNVQYDYMKFDYDNFQEITDRFSDGLDGVDNEPLYSFDAHALRVFLTLFY